MARRKPTPKESKELLRLLVDGSRRSVMPGEFLEQLLEKLGGSDRLAVLIADQMQDATVPAHVRQRMLQSTLDLMKEVGRHHAQPADLGMATKDDLARLARDLLGELGANDDGQEAGETEAGGRQAVPDGSAGRPEQDRGDAAAEVGLRHGPPGSTDAAAIAPAAGAGAATAGAVAQPDEEFGPAGAVA